MKDQDLVRMANQIADFFNAYPKEEAVKGVANHLQKFWEPRMRRQFDAYVAKGGEGLDDTVLKAAALLVSPAG